MMMVMFLYAYISKQNSIVELRLQIPNLSKNLQTIQQENVRLQFEIDQFENPVRLMEMAGHPEFSHLKYPLLNEIITIEVPHSGEF
jgi:cell division protein FtsL